ncbi:pyridoxamine 5'-phosphate oxidase-related FMN-binding protein [Syntrophobotulus glycolicus DSM 8271]|uniref:Pyridoxamine 5'-phosphate oxidase-related FMN-binding protein n=1 Tax=Syntrophobotulus glycolicus (strain DSM 8271 / FlGlyR) TaxID=645991 RepID=F0T0A3_SYNGF|nr:pyridoxamine 5'-phosphate oxidase family protein [Syntrophobotulus glycolicus]ADY56190.1 pyridoxamine 5'-phosphate oxidase-related FMN-binding protein [Syntrophobotulus glycolicus DSM 8271]
MTKQEIFNLMNNNPVFFLATTDNGQPRVRGMLLYKADEEGIIFHTGTMKDLYTQISASPKAEMCFNDFKSGVQVRVRGTLEESKDIKLKDEILEHPSRKFLRDWKENGDLQDFYHTLAVFRMTNGVAVTWTMTDNFEPKTDVEL